MDTLQLLDINLTIWWLLTLILFLFETSLLYIALLEHAGRFQGIRIFFVEVAEQDI